eukprot:TRINITY_DN16376_c0_g1_i1.p1 TRINITY_DN16376_c0_g1~~TRINITY_DN16376_c0_g1_i1.p1  ORF type:complete len:563 (+),score=147.60 TRINITY_DN16376_c0_g1_i1:83-1690(+)
MSVPFSVNDRVLWTGTDGSQAKAVVSAVDERTKPATYIIKCEDGRKKGATEAQLVVDDTYVPSTYDKTLEQVSETAAELAKNAKKTGGALAKNLGKGLGSLKKKMWGKEKKEAGQEASKEESVPPTSSQGGSFNAPGQSVNSGPPASDAGQLDQQIAMLVEMGFSTGRAKSALLLADGDISTAVSLLNQEVAHSPDGDGEDASSTDDASDASSKSGDTGPPREGPSNVSFISLMQNAKAEQTQAQPAPAPSTFDFLDAAPSASPVVSTGAVVGEASPVDAMMSGSASLQSGASPVTHADPFGGMLGASSASPAPPTASTAPAAFAAPAAAAKAPPAPAASAVDAFDFLDGPKPAAPKAAAPAPTPTAQPAAASALRVTSPAAGKVKVVLNSGALPSASGDGTRVSVGIKPEDAPAWRHHVDCASNRVVAFSASPPWEKACLAPDQRTITFSLGTAFKGCTEFLVCARLVASEGAGVACPPVAVAVEDASVVVGMDVLGDFLEDGAGSAGPSGSPRPVPRTKVWPSHRKGAIYDVD